MKRFFLIFVALFLMVFTPMVMAEAVDAIPVEIDPQPIGGTVLVYTIVSLVMWYIVDWLKKILLDHTIPDKIYKLVLLVVCLVIGMLLSFTFKLDAFVLVASIFTSVVPTTPKIEPSTMGYVFGGLMLASGSAVIHEIGAIIRKITGRDNTTE